MEVNGSTEACRPLIGNDKSENDMIQRNEFESNSVDASSRKGCSIDLLEDQPEVPALDDSMSIEKYSFAASELLSSEVCNRAQFWGAVGIFIEKPHILNRRLCGVADLWWGKWSCPQTETTDSEPVKQDQGVEECGQENSRLRDDVDTCSVQETHTEASNVSLDSNTIDNLDDLMLMAWNLMQSKSEDVSKEKNSHDSSAQSTVLDECKVNGQTSVGEEKMLDDLKKLLRNSSFEDIPIIEGRRFEPWPELTAGSKAVYAVVRRALPKQRQRFGTPLELVLLDGRLGRCSVASSFIQPPLLPSRQYHLQHRLEDGRLAIVWHGNESEKQPISDKEVSQARDVTALPDREVSATKSTVPSTFSSGIQWLKDVVLPRVAKWAPQISEAGATDNNGSLTNVDLQAYSALYSNLKSKYADKLVKSWTERTDPHKFVHEDIGIATYILLLWAKLPRPQRFLDLGCGNGLLVYILASEGHLGQGLDIRKRAIWDTFPPFVDLKEHVVRPHDGCLPSEADWLLGNHSDELTPWIPVMASQASHTCSFFVLPCCPHDFTAKFLRRNSSMSQYADYLDYVQEVGEQCGFVMERDRLKIPSTKRVCFVGRTKNHSLEDRPLVLQRLQQFIDKRVAHYINNQSARKEEKSGDRRSVQEGHQQDEDGHLLHTNGGMVSSVAHGPMQGDAINGNQSSPTPQSHLNGVNGGLVNLNASEKILSSETSAGSGGGKLWSSGFVARGREQRTRNCTQLRQDVKDDLVGAVVRVVLGSEPPEPCSPWQRGSSIPLRQVAEALGPRRLQQLKKECGGLQTLLRNHRHIFAVLQGMVTLRPPGKLSEEPKRHRPCWFFLHHPQGCPNTTTSCIYDHTPLGGAVGLVASNVEVEAHA